MKLADRTFMRRMATLSLPFLLIATGLFATSVQAGSAPSTDAQAASAAAPFVPDYFAAPYNGSPISQGLGPTYGDPWCENAAAGTSIAGQQGAPLALIPYEAIGCTLAKFQAEATANSVPARLTYGVNTLTDAGRTQYWAVVNAMETPEQIEGYNNWAAYREKALTDPIAAQALLDSYTNIKLPVFMENNIHGDEEEGADSMMQIIRDLTTLPRGTNPTVDNFLDHAILITIPSMNPDGRFLGTRQNGNAFDMNRDWLVQSQPEVRANLRLQVEWLAPVMFATHGYVNPTLVDGLTKPHNPGLEYDVFAYWNQRRLDVNQEALARIGQGITRPVNGPVQVTVDKRTAISTATSTATTATITTSSAHGLAVGATVVVAGVSDARYDGTFTVATTTATTFTYAVTGPFAAATGGTATGPNTTTNRGNCSNGNTPGPATNICGTLTIAAAPTGITQSGTTVTVTTTTASTTFPPHVADTILISGNTGGYNGGPFRVTSIISPTQFTYEAPAGLPASGGGTVSVQTGPGQGEGWDDLGPFYTQTYGAFWGVDGSTMEMCSSCTAPFTGRLGSKTVQYVGFWSSADFWISNRDQIFDDQVKIFVRGVQDAPRPNCCDDPLVASRGFTEAEHDWMTEYPEAYIIPIGDANQRSDAEANRMAQWVLDNGILLDRATADFTWDGTTYPAGSYIVNMDQPLRGLAFTALGAGIDYSPRINQLYAAPGAWSHGLMWGADTVEVPDNDPTFTPATERITSVSALSGGVAAGAADWYAVKVGGVRDGQAVYGLLHDGVYGEIAEAAFVNGAGGPMPAGSIIFPNDPNTVAALSAAGEAGLTFERGTGAKPTTTRLSEAPKVGILVNSATPAINDQVYSLRRIFGADAVFVSVVNGAGSIQNATDDPLLGIDVLYNTGQGYPAATNAQARSRLNAFFARGGGYIAASSSGNNLSFLTGAVPALVGGSFTTASLSSFGGTAAWANVGGSGSPLTGSFPAQDYLYLPSNVTYFSAIPAGAATDGQYLADMGSAANPRGPTAGYVAGLWLNRNSAAALASNNAPVIIHGNTTAGSRYTGIATSPFSRSDFERIWGWIVQSTLWGDLTDEALLDQTITFDPLTDTTYGDPDFPVTATSTSGRSVSLVAEGDCTVDSPHAPATATITGAGSCTITASQPGDGNFTAAEDVVQTIEIGTAALTVTPNPQNPSRQYSDANPAITPAYDGFVYDDDATDLTTAPTCTTTATSSSNVGPYPITCSGGVSDDYTFVYVPGSLTVTQEDAVIDFNGDTRIYTTGTTAAIVLRATVRDSSLVGSFGDGAAGDIRTATVTFKEGATVLCGPLPVGLIGSPLTIGTATCPVTLPIGSHAITVLVGGNYVATLATDVSIIKPANDSHIEGQGAFNTGTSAGTYKADNGSALSFELSATTSPNKRFGKFTYKAGSKTYQVDLTALTLYGKARQTGGTSCSSAPSATCSGLVYLRGTAKLSDASSKKLVTIGSNFTLVATMTDRGKTGDGVGFTIWDGATLVFSSDWTGGSTAERALTSGNVAAP